MFILRVVALGNVEDVKLQLIRDENKLERYYVCKILLAAFCLKKMNVYFLKYKKTGVITTYCFQF